MEVSINLTPQNINLIVGAMMGDRQTQFPLCPSYLTDWNDTMMRIKSDLETEQLKYDKGSYEYYQLEKEIVHIAGVLKAS